MAGEILGVGTQTITGPIVGTDSSPGSISTSTARAYTLDNMDVDEGLKLKAIEKKLQIESTLDDCFADIGADVVYTGKKVAIPDAVIMKLSTGVKGQHSVTMPMVSPLAGPGRGGTGEAQQGYERGLVLKYMQAYYNEYSQAIAGEEWGVARNQVQLFDLYGQIQPMLSKWFKEDTGYQYRQALLETVAWPLVKAGAGLTAAFNPNIFVMNTALGSQPTWNLDPQTYINSIATVCAAADTGTNGVNANVDLNQLIALDYYASSIKRITPITIGGKATYILLLPSTQYKKLLSTANGQLGSVWQNVASLSTEEQNFTGVIGRVMSMLIVEDTRYPEIAFDDYTAGAAITPSYVKPGNDDGRAKTLYDASTNKRWDCGTLLGAGAIIDWTVTPLHFEKEKTEFGKKYATGAFTERGIQLGLYGRDAGAEKVNYGSIEVLFSSTSLVQVA